MNGPNQVLAEHPLNSREVFRVAISEYQGHRYVDIRRWYCKVEGGEFLPGKGATVRPELLQGVIRALEAAHSQLNGRSDEVAS
ncbi:MAG: hypothetical protein EVA65_16435 [Oceanococcus sp.]|nr:MAG: hypothetical protein EVA65_16435 [Oceanococcus sp.]